MFRYKAQQIEVVFDLLKVSDTQALFFRNQIDFRKIDFWVVGHGQYSERRIDWI